MKNFEKYIDQISEDLSNFDCQDRNCADCLYNTEAQHYCYSSEKIKAWLMEEATEDE